jgi:hypothetical protein
VLRAPHFSTWLADQRHGELCAGWLGGWAAQASAARSKQAAGRPVVRHQVNNGVGVFGVQ